MVGVPGQAVADQHLLDLPARSSAGHAQVGQPELGVLGDGGVHDLRVGVLEHEADPPADLPQPGPGVQPVDQHGAGGGDDEAVEQPGEGALARAVGADHADAVLGEGEGEVAQDGRSP